MKQRLRYISARFGAYPSLFAWVLWIEVNTVSRISSDMAHLHKIIAPFLRDIDLKLHPVTSEFSTAEGCAAVWESPTITYTQVAGYNFGDGLVSVFKTRCRAFRRYDKPFLIEEYAGQPKRQEVATQAHQTSKGTPSERTRYHTHANLRT